MALPSNQEILDALKDIEKRKKKKQHLAVKIPGKDAPLEGRFKFNISQKLLEFKISKGYTIDDMAQVLGTDRANVSKILNGRLDKVSLDRLFSYLRIVILASKDKNLLKVFTKITEDYFEFSELKFG